MGSFGNRTLFGKLDLPTGSLNVAREQHKVTCFSPQLGSSPLI
jgi:hypothetical protein